MFFQRASLGQSMPSTCAASFSQDRSKFRKLHDDDSTSTQSSRCPTYHVDITGSTTTMASRLGMSPTYVSHHRSSSRGRTRISPIQGLSHSPTGGSGIRSDPRPWADRKYVQESARLLAFFLKNKGFGSGIVPEMLVSPNAAEFEQIFKFLIQEIDPTFSFQRKMKEELPAILGAVGYPFSIPKSALGAIGSPHTGPILLGVLKWLMGLVQYSDMREHEEDRKRHNEPTAQRNYAILGNTVEAYVRFLDGEDTFPDLDKKLMRFFVSKNLERQSVIESLESDCRELGNTLRALNIQQSPLELILEHVDSLQVNIDRYSQLIPLLISHERQLVDRVEEIEKQISNEQYHLELLGKEKSELVACIAEQKRGGIIAEKTLSEKNLLQDDLRTVRTSCANVRVRLQAEKNRHADAIDRLERGLKAYGRKVISLSEARNMGVPVDETSLQLNIEEDSHDTFVGKTFPADEVAGIMACIEKYRILFSEHVLKLQKELLSLQEERDRNEEILIVARNEEWLIESRAKNLKNEYEDLRRIFESQLDTRRDIILSREEDLIEMRRESKVVAQKDGDQLLRTQLEKLRLCSEVFHRQRERLHELSTQHESLSGKYLEEVKECLLLSKGYFNGEWVISGE